MKGNSTDTTSLTFNTVIDRIVRGVVPKTILDCQSLPVEIFRCAANQVRQVPTQPKMISKRQSLDRFFNFLNGSHGLPRFVVKRNELVIAFLSFGRATVLRCSVGVGLAGAASRAASGIFMPATRATARACVEFANRDRPAPKSPYEPPVASSMSGSRPDSRQPWQRWRMAAMSASGLRPRSSTMSARDFVPPA